MRSSINQVTEYFKEKVSNPLIPAFITSWCLLNYQVFIFAFSKTNPHEKVLEINKILSSSYLGGYGKTLIIPASISILYVLLYPVIYRKVMVFIETEKVKTNKLLIPINEENPRTTKEFDALDEMHKQKNNDLRREIQELEQRSEQSKRAISELQSINGKNKSEIDDLKVQLESQNQKNATLVQKYQFIEQELDSLDQVRKKENNDLKREIYELEIKLQKVHNDYSWNENLSVQKELGDLIEQGNIKKPAQTIKVGQQKNIMQKKYGKFSIKPN